jgi:hypothetical protein
MLVFSISIEFILKFKGMHTEIHFVKLHVAYKRVLSQVFIKFYWILCNLIFLFSFKIITLFQTPPPHTMLS